MPPLFTAAMTPTWWPRSRNSWRERSPWGFCSAPASIRPWRRVVVAGGGVKNPALMQRIAAALAPIPVRRSDELGVPSDAREAMAFAVLADMTLRGVAAFLPPVTGANAPKLLGKLSFP